MNPEIKFIEYHKTKSGWKPHTVIKDNSIYDFDWCASQDILCFNMSGCGGLTESTSIERFVNAPRLCGKVWVAEGFKIFNEKDELKTKTQFRELGYQKIDSPIEIDSSLDPFEYADSEDSSEYCKFCGRVSNLNTCDHIAYDEYHGGFLLGCGSTEVCYKRTRESLFRLLRFLTNEKLDFLFKNPYGCSLFDWRQFEFSWGEENHYDAGLAWLSSLDKTTKKANTLTQGWIYEYQETHFNRIASPESTLWIELPQKRLSNFSCLGVNEKIDETLTIAFPRKVSNAHDKFFNDSPDSVTEVLLRPKSKAWQPDQVMNIAVRKVEIKKNKATISFSYFIEKGGVKPSRF